MERVLPDYRGACTANLVPALLGADPDPPTWLPASAADADQIVLLVLDGLGWDQMQRHRELVPALDTMDGRAITTVAPSTTATAMTSITTGTTPGEHGVVGYRIKVGDEILNTLRWTTARGDARTRLLPAQFQSIPAFEGHRPPAVTKAEFVTSGFSGAHLAGVRWHPWRALSTLVVEVSRLLRQGEAFVYAYYDGVDKVAHEYGMGEYYEAELALVNHLVDHLRSVLPPGAVLVITADHGQVDVGDAVRPLAPEVLGRTAAMSGEGRFRWLHAHPGESAALLAAAEAAHSDVAWVCSREQVIGEEWLGPKVTDVARERLGDVAVVPFEPIAFHDAADTGPYKLISRHGSLTPAEMWVPLLVG